MKIKTIILLCLINQVLQNHGLVQLKNSLSTSDSPLLMKILQSVDAATSDEHLLDVTIKLLKSLCVCMRETLRAKEEKFTVDNSLLEPGESSNTDWKVLELYRKIYNNTCFNLKQELINRTHQSKVDEETFLNNSNCGKDERNNTHDTTVVSDKPELIEENAYMSKLQRILFKALIQTKDLHKYNLKRYNLYGKGNPHTQSTLKHNIIVILTLHPDSKETPSRKFSVPEEDFNETLHTNSLIDIDIIDTKYDKKGDDITKPETLSDCNLQSLYNFLAVSDKQNLTKVFKFIRKRDYVKIYIEIHTDPNHTDYINVCCDNGTLIPYCNKDFINNSDVEIMALGLKNDTKTVQKKLVRSYRNTITKIKHLVNLYENTKLRPGKGDTNATFESHDHDENINLQTQAPAPQSQIKNNENDITTLVSNSDDPLKLGDVTRAILLLNNFVSKRATKKDVSMHQDYTTERDRLYYDDPWPNLVSKNVPGQDVTTSIISYYTDPKIVGSDLKKYTQELEYLLNSTKPEWLSEINESTVTNFPSTLFFPLEEESLSNKNKENVDNNAVTIDSSITSEDVVLNTNPFITYIPNTTTATKLQQKATTHRPRATTFLSSLNTNKVDEETTQVLDLTTLNPNSTLQFDNEINEFRQIPQSITSNLHTDAGTEQPYSTELMNKDSIIAVSTSEQLKEVTSKENNIPREFVQAFEKTNLTSEKVSSLKSINSDKALSQDTEQDINKQSYLKNKAIKLLTQKQLKEPVIEKLILNETEQVALYNDVIKLGKTNINTSQAGIPDNLLKDARNMINTKIDYYRRPMNVTETTTRDIKHDLTIMPPAQNNQQPNSVTYKQEQSDFITKDIDTNEIFAERNSISKYFQEKNNNTTDMPHLTTTLNQSTKKGNNQIEAYNDVRSDVSADFNSKVKPSYENNVAVGNILKTINSTDLKTIEKQNLITSIPSFENNFSKVSQSSYPIELGGSKPKSQLYQQESFIPSGNIKQNDKDRASKPNKKDVDGKIAGPLNTVINENLLFNNEQRNSLLFANNKTKSNQTTQLNTSPISILDNEVPKTHQLSETIKMPDEALNKNLDQNYQTETEKFNIKDINSKMFLENYTTYNDFDFNKHNMDPKETMKVEEVLKALEKNDVYKNPKHIDATKKSRVSSNIDASQSTWNTPQTENKKAINNSNPGVNLTLPSELQATNKSNLNRSEFYSKLATKNQNDFFFDFPEPKSSQDKETLNVPKTWDGAENLSMGPFKGYTDITIPNNILNKFPPSYVIKEIGNGNLDTSDNSTTETISNIGSVKSTFINKENRYMTDIVNLELEKNHLHRRKSQNVTPETLTNINNVADAAVTELKQTSKTNVLPSNILSPTSEQEPSMKQFVDLEGNSTAKELYSPHVFQDTSPVLLLPFVETKRIQSSKTNEFATFATPEAGKSKIQNLSDYVIAPASNINVNTEMRSNFQNNTIPPKDLAATILSIPNIINTIQNYETTHTNDDLTKESININQIRDWTAPTIPLSKPASSVSTHATLKTDSTALNDTKNKQSTLDMNSPLILAKPNLEAVTVRYTIRDTLTATESYLHTNVPYASLTHKTNHVTDQHAVLNPKQAFTKTEKPLLRSMEYESNKSDYNYVVNGSTDNVKSKLLTESENTLSTSLMEMPKLAKNIKSIIDAGKAGSVTEIINIKSIKPLKSQILAKNPAAFELSIKFGEEASKNGIQFSVLEEEPNLKNISNKNTEKLPNSVTSVVSLNPLQETPAVDENSKEMPLSASILDEMIEIIDSKIPQPNDIFFSNTNITRKSNVVRNEGDDLNEMFSMIDKLSFNPSLNVKTTTPEVETVSVTNEQVIKTTTHQETHNINENNTTTVKTATVANYISKVKHKSMIPGILTQEVGIDKMKVMYKQRIKEFKENLKNKNVSVKNLLPKRNDVEETPELKESIKFPKVSLLNETFDNTTRNNLSPEIFDESVITRKPNKATVRNKNMKKLLNKLLKGRKLSKTQLEKINKLLMKNSTSATKQGKGIVKNKDRLNNSIENWTKATTDNLTVMPLSNEQGILDITQNVSTTLSLNSVKRFRNYTKFADDNSKPPLIVQIDKPATEIPNVSHTVELHNRRRIGTPQSDEYLRLEVKRDSNEFTPLLTSQKLVTEPRQVLDKTLNGIPKATSAVKRQHKSDAYNQSMLEFTTPNYSTEKLYWGMKLDDIKDFRSAIDYPDNISRSNVSGTLITNLQTGQENYLNTSADKNDTRRKSHFTAFISERKTIKDSIRISSKKNVSVIRNTIYDKETLLTNKHKHSGKKEKKIPYITINISVPYSAINTDFPVKSNVSSKLTRNVVSDYLGNNYTIPDRTVNGNQLNNYNDSNNLMFNVSSMLTNVISDYLGNNYEIKDRADNKNNLKNYNNSKNFMFNVSSLLTHVVSDYLGNNYKIQDRADNKNNLNNYNKSKNSISNVSSILTRNVLSDYLGHNYTIPDRPVNENKINNYNNSKNSISNVSSILTRNVLSDYLGHNYTIPDRPVNENKINNYNNSKNSISNVSSILTRNVLSDYLGHNYTIPDRPVNENKINNYNNSKNSISNVSSILTRNVLSDYLGHNYTIPDRPVNENKINNYNNSKNSISNVSSILTRNVLSDYLGHNYTIPDRSVNENKINNYNNSKNSISNVSSILTRNVLSDYLGHNYAIPDRPVNENNYNNSENVMSNVSIILTRNVLSDYLGHNYAIPDRPVNENKINNYNSSKNLMFNVSSMITKKIVSDYLENNDTTQDHTINENKLTNNNSKKLIIKKYVKQRLDTRTKTSINVSSTPNYSDITIPSDEDSSINESNDIQNMKNTNPDDLKQESVILKEILENINDVQNNVDRLLLNLNDTTAIKLYQNQTNNSNEQYHGISNPTEVPSHITDRNQLFDGNLNITQLNNEMIDKLLNKNNKSATKINSDFVVTKNMQTTTISSDASTDIKNKDGLRLTEILDTINAVKDNVDEFILTINDTNITKEYLNQNRSKNMENSGKYEATDINPSVRRYVLPAKRLQNVTNPLSHKVNNSTNTTDSSYTLDNRYNSEAELLDELEDIMVQDTFYTTSPYATINLSATDTVPKNFNYVATITERSSASNSTLTDSTAITVNYEIDKEFTAIPFTTNESALKYTEENKSVEVIKDLKRTTIIPQLITTVLLNVTEDLKTDFLHVSNKASIKLLDHTLKHDDYFDTVINQTQLSSTTAVKNIFLSNNKANLNVDTTTSHEETTNLNYMENNLTDFFYEDVNTKTSSIASELSKINHKHNNFTAKNDENFDNIDISTTKINYAKNNFTDQFIEDKKTQNSQYQPKSDSDGGHFVSEPISIGKYLQNNKLTTKASKLLTEETKSVLYKEKLLYNEFHTETTLQSTRNIPEAATTSSHDVSYFTKQHNVANLPNLKILSSPYLNMIDVAKPISIGKYLKIKENTTEGSTLLTKESMTIGNKENLSGSKTASTTVMQNVTYLYETTTKTNNITNTFKNQYNEQATLPNPNSQSVYDDDHFVSEPISIGKYIQVNEITTEGSAPLAEVTMSVHNYDNVIDPGLTTIIAQGAIDVNEVTTESNYSNKNITNQYYNDTMKNHKHETDHYAAHFVSEPISIGKYLQINKITSELFIKIAEETRTISNKENITYNPSTTKTLEPHEILSIISQNKSAIEVDITSALPPLPVKDDGTTPKLTNKFTSTNKTFGDVISESHYTKMTSHDKVTTVFASSLHNKDLKQDKIANATDVKNLHENEQVTVVNEHSRKPFSTPSNSSAEAIRPVPSNRPNISYTSLLYDKGLTIPTQAKNYDVGNPIYTTDLETFKEPNYDDNFSDYTDSSHETKKKTITNEPNDKDEISFNTLLEDTILTTRNISVLKQVSDNEQVVVSSKPLTNVSFPTQPRVNTYSNKTEEVTLTSVTTVGEFGNATITFNRTLNTSAHLATVNVTNSLYVADITNKTVNEPNRFKIGSLLSPLILTPKEKDSLNFEELLYNDGELINIPTTPDNSYTSTRTSTFFDSSITSYTQPIKSANKRDQEKEKVENELKQDINHTLGVPPNENNIFKNINVKSYMEYKKLTNASKHIIKNLTTDLPNDNSTTITNSQEILSSTISIVNKSLSHTHFTPAVTMSTLINYDSEQMFDLISAKVKDVDDLNEYFNNTDTKEFEENSYPSHTHIINTPDKENITEEQNDSNMDLSFFPIFQSTLTTGFDVNNTTNTVPGLNNFIKISDENADMATMTSPEILIEDLDVYLSPSVAHTAYFTTSMPINDHYTNSLGDNTYLENNLEQDKYSQKKALGLPDLEELTTQDPINEHNDVKYTSEMKTYPDRVTIDPAVTKVSSYNEDLSDVLFELQNIQVENESNNISTENKQSYQTEFKGKINSLPMNSTSNSDILLMHTTKMHTDTKDIDVITSPASVQKTSIIPIKLKLVNTPILGSKIYIVDPYTMHNILNRSIEKNKMDVKVSTHNIMTKKMTLNDYNNTKISTENTVSVEAATSTSQGVLSTINFMPFETQMNKNTNSIEFTDAKYKLELESSKQKDAEGTSSAEHGTIVSQNITERLKSIESMCDSNETLKQNSALDSKEIICKNNKTNINFIIQIGTAEKNISYIHTPTLSKIKVTKLKPVNATNINMNLDKNERDSESKMIEVKSDTKVEKKVEDTYKSNFQEFLTNVRNGKLRGENVMNIFSSRIHRPNAIRESPAAVTKNIRYNTYQPTTKEDLELLKFDNKPIFNTLLYKKVDVKPHYHPQGLNNSCVILKSLRKTFRSEAEFIAVLKAANCSKEILEQNQNNKISLLNSDHLKPNELTKNTRLTPETNKKVFSNGTLKSLPFMEPNKNPPNEKVNKHPITREINIKPPLLNVYNNLQSKSITGTKLPMNRDALSVGVDYNRNSSPSAKNNLNSPLWSNGILNSPKSIQIHSNPTDYKPNFRTVLDHNKDLLSKMKFSRNLPSRNFHEFSGDSFELIKDTVLPKDNNKYSDPIFDLTSNIYPDTEDHKNLLSIMDFNISESPLKYKNMNSHSVFKTFGNSKQSIDMNKMSIPTKTENLNAFSQKIDSNNFFPIRKLNVNSTSFKDNTNTLPSFGILRNSQQALETSKILHPTKDTNANILSQNEGGGPILLPMMEFNASATPIKDSRDSKYSYKSYGFMRNFQHSIEANKDIPTDNNVKVLSQKDDVKNLLPLGILNATQIKKDLNAYYNVPIGLLRASHQTHRKNTISDPNKVANKNYFLQDEDSIIFLPMMAFNVSATPVRYISTNSQTSLRLQEDPKQTVNFNSGLVQKHEGNHNYFPQNEKGENLSPLVGFNSGLVQKHEGNKKYFSKNEKSENFSPFVDFNSGLVQKHERNDKYFPKNENVENLSPLVDFNSGSVKKHKVNKKYFPQNENGENFSPLVITVTPTQDIITNSHPPFGYIEPSHQTLGINKNLVPQNKESKNLLPTIEFNVIAPIDVLKKKSRPINEFLKNTQRIVESNLNFIPNKEDNRNLFTNNKSSRGLLPTMDFNVSVSPNPHVHDAKKTISVNRILLPKKEVNSNVFTHLVDNGNLLSMVESNASTAPIKNTITNSRQTHDFLKNSPVKINKTLLRKIEVNSNVFTHKEDNGHSPTTEFNFSAAPIKKDTNLHRPTGLLKSVQQTVEIKNKFSPNKEVNNNVFSHKEDNESLLVKDLNKKPHVFLGLLKKTPQHVESNKKSPLNDISRNTYNANSPITEFNFSAAPTTKDTNSHRTTGFLKSVQQTDEINKTFLPNKEVNNNVFSHKEDNESLLVKDLNTKPHAPLGLLKTTQQHVESNKKSPSPRSTYPGIDINRNLHKSIVNNNNNNKINVNKESLLNPFEKHNTYAVKMTPPTKAQKKPMKRMKLGKRRMEVMTMNTQDFFSQHRFVTRRNMLRNGFKNRPAINKPVTLIPRHSILRPKFETIDKPTNKFEHKMRPKPLIIKRTDNMFRDQIMHHHPDIEKWRISANTDKSIVHKIGLTSRKTKVNNVIDRPLWHPTEKPKFFKDRIDSLRNYLYNADYVKATRRTVLLDHIAGDPESGEDESRAPQPARHIRRNNVEMSSTQVTDWWLDDMYLKVRLPLPINSNPGMVFPRRHFAKMEEVADLGALFIDDLLDYKEMLDRGELPLERATSREKGQPLCMEQFYRLLGVCRIPEVGRDRLELPRAPAAAEEGEELVVVACRNYFYPIPVKAADRGRLTPGEMQAQLLHAMVDAAGAPPAPRVGLLTSMNRDQWARAREQLIKDETNRMNMELISRALCIVCLDEAGGDRADTDADTNAMLRAMHGAGTRHHSANRWFDKTVQLIISSDGTIGMCYEHSAAEGVAVVRLAERALARAEVADRPAPPPALLPAPQAMRWNVTNDVQRTIEQAARDLDRAISDLDHKVYTYRGYGREYMKSCRTSPDVYIQLALQYAYYKMYGYLVTTYESASLRRFRNGRVDNIRSAHDAALAWAAAMCTAETPPLNDSADDSQKKVSFNLYGEQKKLELFEEAARKQTSIMEANILGKGLDNHLLGLREAARETLGELPPVFSDTTYKQMIEFKLSTSQVATTTDGTFMGYGAVCPDGYGCSYNPKKDSIIFCISSFTSSSVTNTEAFRQSLEEALDSMKLMFQARQADN